MARCSRDRLPAFVSSRRRLCVLLITVVVGVGGASAVGAPAGAASSGWDARIKPIADEVAKLRGLDFKHPVPVTFLSDAAFDKKVAVDDKLSKQDKADLEHNAGEFRAIGLMAAGVDLLDAVNSFQTSGVLAFYSPKTKRVTVKGEDIDVSTRVTLAHELTHALQDQYFDLTKLDKEAAKTHSDSALKAMVEGDAVRVQRLYEKKLSADDQAAYEDAQSADSAAAADKIHAKGVPDSISTLFQAPYVLGPIMLALVESEKKGGIDDLFTHPPTTDAAYLTPGTLLDGAETVKVATPKLGKGEKAVDKPDVFGSFALYLMLAGRGDAGEALSVADSWGGDSMITYARAGTTCIRAAFAARSGNDTAALADALTSWAAKMPGGTASSTRDGSVVTLDACDPGASATDPPNSSNTALIVADLRNEVLSQIVKAGAPVATGKCVATGLIRDPAMQPIIAQAAADPSASLSDSDTKLLQQKVLSLAASCAKK
jgi:hypothetical protein